MCIISFTHLQLFPHIGVWWQYFHSNDSASAEVDLDLAAGGWSWSFTYFFRSMPPPSCTSSMWPGKYSVCSCVYLPTELPTSLLCYCHCLSCTCHNSGRTDAANVELCSGKTWWTNQVNSGVYTSQQSTLDYKHSMCLKSDSEVSILHVNWCANIHGNQRKPSELFCDSNQVQGFYTSVV